MTLYNVSHKNCDDGAMSSAIVKKFRPEAVVVFSTYEHDWKKTNFQSGDSILFTDFCPLPADLYELHTKGVEFQVLDHHITAQKNIDAYWETNPKEANLIRSRMILNMDKCGSTLTWDYLAPAGSVRPRVLDFIEIADIWKWERDANSPAVTQYMRVTCRIGSWEDMLALLDNFDEAKAIENGKILTKRLQADIEDIYKKSDVVELFGWKVRIVNSGHANSISELGHKLAENSPDGVGLIYNIMGNKLKLSTRGKAGTTVARELAEKFGGGGHNEAAGAFLQDAKVLLNLIVK